MRKCKACERLMPLSRFDINPGCIDGRRHQCRDCVNQRVRARRPPKKSLAARFWEKVDCSNCDSCWEWTGALTSAGYGNFRVANRRFQAHRHSWAMANPTVVLDSSEQVCHSCDNRKCVNPSHLFKGSARDNQMDCLKKGRRAYRLNEDKVFQIRALLLQGLAQRAIARRFGVSPQTINNVHLGHCWTHI